MEADITQSIILGELEGESIIKKNKAPYIIHIQCFIYLNSANLWSCRESNPGPNKQQNRFLHA